MACGPEAATSSDVEISRAKDVSIETPDLPNGELESLTVEEVDVTFACFKNPESNLSLSNTLVHCSFWDEDMNPVYLHVSGELLLIKIGRIQSVISEKSISGLQWDIWLEGEVDLSRIGALSNGFIVAENINVTDITDVMDMPEHLDAYIMDFHEDYLSYDAEVF